MMLRRLTWQIVVAAALLVLLGVLATLQYRWLGAVSEAERERMRAGLRTRTSEFTRDFNAEITRTYMAFHVDLGANRDAAGALAEAYQRWLASAPVSDLVRAVYLLEQRADTRAKVLGHLDVDGRRLEPVDWPEEIAAALARPLLPPMPDTPAPGAGDLHGGVDAPGPGAVEGPPLLMFDPIDPHIPALFVAVPFVRKATDGQQFTLIASGPARTVIVVLNREALERRLLQPLVAKHFGERAASEYLVTIVRRDDSSPPVYHSGDWPVDAAAADVTMGLFDLRLDVMNPAAIESSSGRLHMTDRVAITVLRRTGPGEGRRLFLGGDEQGAWQVRVRYRSGSLEALVAQSRRRNLAIGLGVLGLLGASFVLVLAAAQRRQRLARQQMEFVAAVSHELRTPLAVICSAGENLADGVVADQAQVKRYGSLIQSEGHRLRDMVERVLEFSGIRSATPQRPHGLVDFSQVIAGAVETVGREANERGVAMTVDASTPLQVTGDADALRSAVVNILGNAVKYSPAGASVAVTASLHGNRVRFVVADRGLGIDREDLPHIFKPFYRGRRASDAQVRGTGVGLSIVGHVIDAHRGDIRVESRPGEGTTVIVELVAAGEPGIMEDPAVGGERAPLATADKRT